VENTSLKVIDVATELSPLEGLEREFAKDRWDARNIPGLRYAAHTGNYYIRFTGVPERFRPLVKDYVKFQLVTGRAASTLNEAAYYLGHFFTFFLKLYPNAETLHNLTTQDIDAFILTLRATRNKRGAKISDGQIVDYMLRVEGLLHYLERFQSPMKPHKPAATIVWPQHYPRYVSSSSRQVKYIPETVLRQLDTTLEHLPSIYIPVVIVLRASGWRISDVLSLKHELCLEYQDGHFWLVGDIQKTRVFNHRIPITQEVATVVLAQIALVMQQYTPEENPRGWLFPAPKERAEYRRRFLQGEPLCAAGVNNALNRLAEIYHIRDEQGNIFHFRSHAFRHTKAVELINNGMSLVMVQQWMAHASPEMTLVYAKIQDKTMREQWEKTLKHGIVQFNDGKPEYVSGRKMLTILNEPETFNPERVRDYRANLKLPLGNCLKPPKLVCKFTELPCFHCPAYVLTPDDLPALETYEQQILERIAIGRQANNAYWIEVNQKNLDERLRPAIAMLKQGQIVAKTEKYEREYTLDEWAERQAQPAETNEKTT
jgi:integrase